MSKVYNNGPASGQGMHYFNQPAYQAASMNGPPPHMQMAGGYNMMGGDTQRMEPMGIGAAQPQQPYSLSQELLDKVQQSPNGVALVEVRRRGIGFAYTITSHRLRSKSASSRSSARDMSSRRGLEPFEAS